MTIIEIIGALTPLGVQLIKEIFGDKSKIKKSDASARIKEIQAIIKNAREYLEKIKEYGEYLDVYLELGLSAEKIAAIVERVRVIDKASSGDISKFMDQCQDRLNDLQEIFDTDISTFDFAKLQAIHSTSGQDNRERISNALISVSAEKDILSDDSKSEVEKRKAKTEMLKSLTVIKQMVDRYIGYKNKILKGTINQLMLGK